MVDGTVFNTKKEAFDGRIENYLIHHWSTILVIVAPNHFFRLTLLNRAFWLLVRTPFIFWKHQLLLATINHVIYFSQSQLLLAKTIKIELQVERLYCLYEKHFLNHHWSTILVIVAPNDFFRFSLVNCMHEKHFLNHYWSSIFVTLSGNDICRFSFS